MKSNLKKLTDKLKNRNKNCFIPVKDLNELNQVVIALKNAGYKGLHTADNKKRKFRNHIADAKYFCYYFYDNIQNHPIGISVYNYEGEGKGFMIVNWDVTKEKGATILKL